MHSAHSRTGDRTTSAVPRSRGLPLALTLLLAMAGSCTDIPTAAPPAVPEPDPAQPRVLGMVAVRFSVTGPGNVSSSISVVEPDRPAPGGPQLALSTTEEGAVGGIIIEILPGAGSFTHGVPGAGGFRYVFASGLVRNAGINFSEDTIAYTTPRPNLTVVATAVPSGGGFGGIAGTPFADLSKFDGTPADPAIASEIIPTGAVRQTLTGGITTYSADVLQVFTEDEVAVLAPTYDPFPYGFVVQHATETDTRTLAANPGPTQYDGIITFGIKIPLQASAADDVHGFSMFFAVVDDSETRVTQSLEEQDPTGQAAFEARVAALTGLSGVTLLPGGSYGGSVPAPVRMLCAVRIAGTPAAPVAFLDGAAAATCPTLTAVSPNSGVQGTTESVTLTGTNFDPAPGATTVAVSGTGVTVTNVSVAGPTSLTADFVIDGAAATGARNVTVTTASGSNAAQVFTVTVPPPPPPTLTSVGPNSAPQGGGASVTLTGTDFVPGATTVFVSGTGVDVLNLIVASGTSLTADFAVDPGAPLGPRNVTVTTAGGTSGAQTFTIIAPPGSAEFNFTGAEQDFVVPAGVTTLTIESFGAQGGQGFNNALGWGTGGNGGYVTATISVTAGETLKIFVGGQGGAASNGGAGAAGFNGGAAGGSQADAGGGGGGASDIRQEGADPSDRVVIAGGGGGGGGSGNGGPGGHGGNVTGGAGFDSGAGTATGGGGGTSTAGGAPGTGDANSGAAGSLVNGGAGGNGAMSGGGGGGGNFGGGGGGGANAPGGGGAGGGGGGSSFVIPGASGVTHQQGVQTGHGRVVITW